MELIEISILTGLVAIVILLILISVLAYKLRRIKKQRGVKKPIEVEELEKKIEAEEVEKRKERTPFFKRVRKPQEAKEYDVWK